MPEYTPEVSSTANAELQNRIPARPAENWTREQWETAYRESFSNPYIAGTVTAKGIQHLYETMVSQGAMPGYFDVALWMGGAWTGTFKPSTTGSVTLEPGEVQTPTGIAGPTYNPPPSTSGAIPPSPTGNVPQVISPTTIPVRNEVDVVSPVPATGGQAPVGNPIPQVLPTVTVTATPVAPTWLPVVAIALVVLFLLQRK